MPHLHTEPGQHDHTVSAYIIRDDMDEPRLLLHMHKKLGMLLPVGGHIELNETPWQSLIHELEEEAGYKIEDVDILQPEVRLHQRQFSHIVVHPQPFLMNTHLVGDAHYHSDTGYILVAHTAPTVALAEGESSDLRWLTRDELEAVTATEIWQSTRLASLAVFDMLAEWQPVPTSEFRTDKLSEGNVTIQR